MSRDTISITALKKEDTMSPNTTQPIQTPQSPPTPPKSGWKATAIIFIILSILLVGLAVFLVTKKLYKQECETCETSVAEEDGDETIGRDVVNYFTIKEWGIKFRIPEGLENLVYSISGDSEDVDRVSITTSDLNQCGGRGMLLRSTDANIVKNVDGSISNPTYWLNDKYYWYQHPQSLCTEDEDGTEYRTVKLIQQMLTVPFNQI